MDTAPPRAGRQHPLEQALYEVKKTIVGQDELLERMLVALLARGHLLVEGVPGLAKTMAIKTLAQADRRRVPADPVHPRPGAGRPHRHPDLQPAGRASSRSRSGPVFANLVLADEINRAPAKVQSALLEVMQERQVTIGRETYQAPDPFLVMATQNPIESEGTYPLPEAQVDRFMLKVLVGYPTAAEEFVVVERMTAALEETAAGDRHRAAGAVAAGGRRGLRRPRGDPVRRPAGQRHPRPGAVGLPDLRPLPDLRRQPARLDQHGAGGQGPGLPARPRLRAARRTSATSPGTCCGTAWCCPTRRWPRTSAPTTCSARSSTPSPCPTCRCASAVRSQQPRPSRLRTAPVGPPPVRR